MAVPWLVGRVVSGRGASRCWLGKRNSRQNGEHIAGHAVYGAVVGPLILPAAWNGGYRPPKVPGWAEHMGNVGLYANLASHQKEGG